MANENEPVSTSRRPMKTTPLIDEVVGLVREIEGIAELDVDRRRSDFERRLLPLLGGAGEGDNGHGGGGGCVFCCAAYVGCSEVLSVFQLEQQLFPDRLSRIRFGSDAEGNPPFVLALLDVDEGPNFPLASALLNRDNRPPPEFVAGGVERALIEKSLVVGTSWEYGALSSWRTSLETMRRNYEYLLPRLEETRPFKSADSIAWETMESMNEIPIPFLVILLLGLRLRTSLSINDTDSTFLSQQALVDDCIVFLEKYMRSSAFSVSRKNASEETIFEFLQRLYFVWIGDPLQLLRHFAFFLSWGSPPADYSVLEDVIDNPFLNPLERLNYVVLLAAANLRYPINEQAEEISISDAITRVNLHARHIYNVGAALREANLLGENADEASQAPAEVEAPRIGETGEAAAEAPRAAPAARTEHESPSLTTTAGSMKIVSNLWILASSLHFSTPSLKFLTRRMVRDRLGSDGLARVARGRYTGVIPSDVVDFIRMQEFRSKRFEYNEYVFTAAPTERAGHLSLQHDQAMYLQIPVIHFK